jgi:hypothetical protein
MPTNPTGLLITIARRRAIDRIRRERTLAAKTEQLEGHLRHKPEDTMSDVSTFPDERLELIATCCHLTGHLGSRGWSRVKAWEKGRARSPPSRAGGFLASLGVVSEHAGEGGLDDQVHKAVLERLARETATDIERSP